MRWLRVFVSGPSQKDARDLAQRWTRGVRVGLVTTVGQLRPRNLICMSEWKKLGPIVLCQIHTDRMIHEGVYRDELLTEVDSLWLSPDGVVGLADGRAVLHAHHRLHPTRMTGTTEKHRAYLPHRLLSFGFTSHYKAMAERFGAAALGCAAEDIIVEYDHQVSLAEVAAGVQIRRLGRIIGLLDAEVATPCVPFTRYLLGDQRTLEDRVAAHRAFLDDGMRGFIVGLADHTEPVDVAVGDEFWIRV
jgi:hypothetical protein